MYDAYVVSICIHDMSSINVYERRISILHHNISQYMLYLLTTPSNHSQYPLPDFIEKTVTMEGIYFDETQQKQKKMDIKI